MEIEPRWHLNKEEIAEIIRQLRAEDPDVNPYAIYLALQREQRIKQMKAEQVEARDITTGERRRVTHLDGELLFVERVTNVPPAFIEAFKENFE